LGERDAPGGRPAPQRCGLGTPLCRGTRPTADATRHGDASRRAGHALASVAHAVASIRRSGRVPARGGGGTLSTYTTRSTGTSTIFSTTLSTGTCAAGGLSDPTRGVVPRTYGNRSCSGQAATHLDLPVHHLLDLNRHLSDDHLVHRHLHVRRFQGRRSVQWQRALHDRGSEPAVQWNRGAAGRRRTSR
jgi:hypothetical protein